MGRAQRFGIFFDGWFRALPSAMRVGPQSSYLELDQDSVYVRMGWAFRARFARGAVQRAARLERAPLSRGVHGFGGRWLVNGSGQRIVVLDLAPGQRARVLGVPVRLRQLMVSVDDPEQLIAQLGAGYATATSSAKDPAPHPSGRAPR